MALLSTHNKCFGWQIYQHMGFFVFIIYLSSEGSDETVCILCICKVWLYIDEKSDQNLDLAPQDMSAWAFIAIFYQNLMCWSKYEKLNIGYRIYITIIKEFSGNERSE